MVRLGPSAGNKQSWRIFKEPTRDTFHFYTINPKDGRFLQYSKFRPIDIGIGVCHFDLTAKELGIEGNWVFGNPEIPGSEELSYIISWSGQN